MMDFLKSNYLETTTSLTILSGTDTASYILRRNLDFQYVTSGYNSDSTVASIRVNFLETMTVSRIAIMGHNLKDYRIYYNGVTANTFAFTTTSSTVTSNFASNSETSQYFECTPVGCTSVSIDMRKTLIADTEKAIGYLMLSDIHFQLDRPPPSKGFKINVDPKDVVHTLSDGGTRIHNVADKYVVNLSYNYLSTSQRNSLYNLWKLHNEFIFCPFGTATSFDEILFPCVWTGNFEFFNFSDNAISSGHSGKINLMETPE